MSVQIRSFILSYRSLSGTDMLESKTSSNLLTCVLSQFRTALPKATIIGRETLTPLAEAIAPIAKGNTTAPPLPKPAANGRNMVVACKALKFICFGV
jgi:hypothetical protein